MLLLFLWCTWSAALIMSAGIGGKVGLVWGNTFLAYFPPVCECLRSRGKFFEWVKTCGATEVVPWWVSPLPCMQGASRERLSRGNFWCIKYLGLYYRNTKSLNRWGWGDLWSSSMPIPLLKQSHLAQHHLQMSLNIFRDGDSSGQPVPVFTVFTGKKKKRKKNWPKYRMSKLY